MPPSSALSSEQPPTADEISKKLRGGVWENSEFARSVYGSTLTFGRFLSRIGVTPNALTYVSLALAVAAGVAAAGQWLFTSAVLLLSSGLFDLLDGIVARAAKRSTRFGALLDSTVDRLADALPVLGLVLSFADRPLPSAVLVLAMMSGFAVSYVRARAEGLGMQLPTLFMRRAERVVLLTLALMVGSVSYPGFASDVAMISIIGVTAVLSSVAAIWALRVAYRAEQQHEVAAAPAELRAKAAPTPTRP